MSKINNISHVEIIKDLTLIINNAKSNIARTINSELLLTYWHIGNRINREILMLERAEYGEEIIKNISRELSIEYGKGFSKTNISNMVKFSTIYNDLEIIQTLSGQLSWSHFIELIYVEEPLKREFYLEIAKIERWSVRVLKEKINGMMFERTSISRKSDELISKELRELRQNERLSPDLVFRDPYNLEFLQLNQDYTEREFENAILQSMEKFLLEFGSDFAFLARQKRITIDGEDYRIDLMFFHRRLRCPIIIELKMGKFKAADKGQMELYLRWIEKYELNEGENPPIGIILCSEKSTEHVELLQLEKSGIKIAQFLTELPPKQVFEKQLLKSIEIAKAREFSPNKNP